MMRTVLFAIVSLAAGGIFPAFAQHGIDVERQSANGEHFKALVAYQKLPERTVTNDVRIAAAQSAWALGLHDRAAEQFDVVLRSTTPLSPERRARIQITRGIIEYQEGHYQEANLFAEKGISLLREASPLRARGLMLLGQSYMSMKSYGLAEEKLSNALEEASDEDRYEIQFHLGAIRVKLGKYEKAQSDLKAIPVNHDRAAQSLKLLGKIAFDTANWKNVQLWLEKGKAEFPDEFLDSWVDYALIRAASEQGKTTEVTDLIKATAERYPPSDPWVAAAEAIAERDYWKSVRGGSADGSATE